MVELQKRLFKASCLLSVNMNLVALLLWLSLTARASMAATQTIRVGVILNLNSRRGSMIHNAIVQAVKETDTATKIKLELRNISQNDVVAAAEAAWDLINNTKVNAILGPQNSEQARHVVEIGDKTNVFVIWFSPSGPSLLPPRTRFFVHSDSSKSHCSQFEAIAAIIKAYNWQSVIPIYEWPEFGIDLIPCLSNALQEMGTRMPNTSAIHHNFKDHDIEEELKKIKGKGTYVFVAHMTIDLWSRLVKLAQKVEMMSEGYAWILTQGLSPVLDPTAKEIKEEGHMDGVLGVRPSLNDVLEKNLIDDHNVNLSLYGLWAYDTITALANATELRKAVIDVDLEGRSGSFSLRQGQLEPSQFVIYNVMKGPSENIIGYWRPETGLFQNFSDGKPPSKGKLRDPTWPGNTTKRPPVLKIGVPKSRFTEFVNVSEGKSVVATGFAVDVFKKVVDVLQFNYSFVHILTPSNYCDLPFKDMKNKNVDVIIGDITITSNRSDCVAFTMPYLDSSVSMVVKVRSDSKSGGILLKPFDGSLWLILSAIFAVATAIVIILERTKKDNGGEKKLKNFVPNPFLIYMSDVDQSFKRLTSKWVVIVVTFLLGIAVQVYTANLTSILSERTAAKPSPWKDLLEIKKNNGKVGYQNDSWVKDLLIDLMGSEEDWMKPLGSREEYNEALLHGDKNKRVDAIFDETPYLRLLLSKCTSCKMTGPIYKAGGFAFAFPKSSSSLVSNFSAEILKVTQDVTTFLGLKKNNSLPFTIDKSEYKSNVETRSLKIDDFGGLFPIVFSILALFFGLSILKLPSIIRWLEKKLVPSWTVSGGGVIYICC